MKVSGKYNQIFGQEVVRALHQDSQARLEVKATFRSDGTMKRIDEVLKVFGPDDDRFDEASVVSAQIATATLRFSANWKRT